MSAESARAPFGWYAGLSGGVAGVALALSAFLPMSPGARLGALVGCGAAALSGAVALPLKRWAVAKSTNHALGAVAGVFGLRAVLVAAGLWGVLRQDGATWGFTLGFFGLYLVLQWSEISYVVAERKRLGPGV